MSLTDNKASSPPGTVAFNTDRLKKALGLKNITESSWDGRGIGKKFGISYATIKNALDRVPGHGVRAYGIITVSGGLAGSVRPPPRAS